MVLSRIAVQSPMPPVVSSVARPPAAGSNPGGAAGADADDRGSLALEFPAGSSCLGARVAWALELPGIVGSNSADG